MKNNRYVYLVSLDEKRQVLFNGLNKEFLVIDKEAVPSFVKVIKTPNEFMETHAILMKSLICKGFVVEDDFDEKKFLRQERDSYIQAKEFKSTILPTFECNYKCWYCTQKHEAVEIDMTKIDLIIWHIKKYLLENNIESYVLSWFGGEPLTQPQIIDYVSGELKQYCESYNIEYTGAITSNGALLSVSNIEMLKRNGINYYQIAIDGDEHTHNLNKKEGLGKSSFALVLSNIVNLLRENPMANVVLRLNYTLATLKSSALIYDITKYISKEWRSRIVVDLQKVWQIKEESIPMDLLVGLQERFVENGFELATNHVFAMCYVEKEHYNMYYYNGGVEKCDKRTIDKLRGHLDENGDVVWDERPIFQDYDLFDDKCCCNNCLYYPLCYCGCPVLREDRIIENQGRIVCGHKGSFDLFEMRIKDYCWRVINNQKVKKYEE